jgi:hypothetical protein
LQGMDGQVGLVQQLVSYLQVNAYGIENAVPAAQICHDLQIPERDLRDIRMEAEKEHPILSDQNTGYWMAASPEEVEQVRERLRTLLIDNSKRMKRLKHSSRRAFAGQQMTMEV